MSEPNFTSFINTLNQARETRAQQEQNLTAAQIQAVLDYAELLEECLVEMANLVYNE